MKNLLLTIILSCTCIFASAQFMVVTNVAMPEGEEKWGSENITDNLGIGYQLNNKIVIGAVKNGEDYDLFGRYNMNENVYISMQTPTDSTDNMKIGVGYSVGVGKNLYVEPNYSMRMKENDEGDRNGEFRLGLAYRF